jgi:hypothetical protein
MAPTSVPTPDDFIASFPKRRTKIDDEPDYDDIKELRTVIKTCAASIRSSKGGGARGYLGYVLAPNVYATIDPTAWIDPVNPGVHPVFPANATAAQINVITRAHDEDMREWNEFNNLKQALMKLVTDSIDPIFVSAIKDQHVEFNDVSMQDMLEFLFTQYGDITSKELAKNGKKMLEPWNPSTPLATLITQIEDCVEYASSGAQPYTATQILNTAFNIIFDTGLFFDECEKWEDKDPADQTWANFKLHFLRANKQLRKRQQTTQEAGYHGANSVQQTKDTQILEETAEALANLATASNADRSAFTTLTNTVADLTKQLKEQQTLIH